MRTRILWFAFCMIQGLVATARQWTFQNIGIKEGMSNGFVVDITIDGNGFVWAATESGLSRISGNRCTSYTTSNSNILCNELKSVFYHEGSNKLCIGTEKGLSIYDCRKQQFSNFTPEEGLAYMSVNDIFMASNGGIWLVFWNGKVQYMDINKNLPSKEVYDTRLPSRCGLDDGNGNLLIGHIYDGFSVINTKSGQIKNYKKSEGQQNGLPANNVRAIHKDFIGRIWIGTSQGLALYHPNTDEPFTHVRLSTGDSYLSHGENYHGISESADHHLWLASDMGGISVIDLNMLTTKQEFIASEQIDATNSNLSSVNTRSIVQDRFGNIWIGSHSTGIDFMPAQKKLFNFLPYYDGRNMLKPVYGLSISKNGDLWIGGEDELTLWRNGFPAKVWNISSLLGQIRHSFIRCVMTDSHGYIWLGVEDIGAFRFNPQKDTFEKILTTDIPLDVRSLYEDDEGKVWICSEKGIYTYQHGLLNEEKAINGLISRGVVTSVSKNEDGTIVIGTLGSGIYIIDKNSQSRHIDTNNGLPSNCVNQVLCAGNGNLWIATYEGLVYIEDLRHLDDIVTFDERQGLTDHHVRAIQQDTRGRIWMSTYTSIACFDREKQRFFNYDYNNNMPVGNFVEASVAVSTDGAIFFGSPTGICYFSPHLIDQNRKVSPVHIICCERLSNQSEKTLYTIMTPNENDVVDLQYNENTFRFSWTIEDFSQDSYVDYSYQMRGLDDEWYDMENNNVVTFRNLQAGKYLFKIRAKLKNQSWEEATESEMNVIIHPPFWLAWWAKLLYLLIAVWLAWFYFNSFKRKLQLRNSLELERQENLQKQELNEERLRFFTNVTHELRTPLTLIIGPLEDLSCDHRLPEVLQKRVNSIKTSADRLLGLINQILEFRKTETRNRRLTVARGNLCALVKEIGEHYKDLNRNPKVTIHVIVNPSIPSVYYDSEVISSIVNNLMSNAVKYTSEGKIHLIMNTNNDGDIEISVMDTGYGISPEALPHIFDRYYQAKGKHQASGTGIGLALVKSLADLHEGKLTVVSKVGKGSKFTFTLNVANTYPQALHKEDEGSEKLFAERSGKSERAADNEELPLMLVVEDNSDIRQYIQESLCEDYRIIQATNGLEGVNAALEQIPDIIVSDIMMPEMDGVELTKRLKKDIRTSHIPIILLTAKTSVSDQQEGYDSGADSYLTKPFSAGLLLSRVRNLLSARRRLAEILLQNVQATGTQTTETNGLSENEAETLPIANRLDREFLDKLNQLIDDNLSVEDLDISYMTDKMAMSRSTLYRKVKALTNISPNEYIRKRKLNVSIDLLKSGENTITEIAYMTGFNSLHHFSHAFKKEFGVSPSEYLRK